MKEILFGTAGIPLSASRRNLYSGIEEVARLGLDAMELEFVRGVRLGESEALKVKEKALSENVILTAHAPYYVNLNTPEPEKLERSRSHLLKTARIAGLAGAVSFTFHPGFYLKDEPETAYENIRAQTAELLGEIRKEGFDILMSPETTGKASVFGSLDEILKLAEEISGLNLCVDFAHLYSRSLGKLNSYEDFCEVLERIRRINPALLDALHIHISGIQYGEKGEVRHLPLGESGFDYRACLDALIDYGVKGVAVCESPALERDALILKEYYENRKAGEY